MYSAAQYSADIVDFDAYKKRRKSAADITAKPNDFPLTPMFFWYPVWVFVPQQLFPHS